MSSFLLQVHLHQYSRKERQVQFYADKLCVTPDYLTKILKEASRMTTKEIIEEAVIMEARKLLMDNSLTIAQIADMLHFSDQSFFGKFFKKKMKISPNFFRNQYKK
ncbi:MAG: helix-turn-helix domain-containing protein [Zunongwangia sp.]|uniref:helix-turn-helix domain-containing protein n=1 Tax=Zunongwangia sp. TaxID=1965325 RepID=UPI003242F35A